MNFTFKLRNSNFKLAGSIVQYNLIDMTQGRTMNSTLKLCFQYPIIHYPEQLIDMTAVPELPKRHFFT